MKPFPSINQFRSVLKLLSNSNKNNLLFKGTVKLHGTNASLAFAKNMPIKYQSRQRVLSLNDDNAGFMAATQSSGAYLESYYFGQYPAATTIEVYGEWCGGNIQKNVAICQLEKRFIIFAVRVDDVWQPYLGKPVGFYTTDDFIQYYQYIDLSYPEEARNTLVEITNDVEAECPVAKDFGVSGIGEGVVWRCITPGFESSDYWFKVKGDKHSVSKVSTLTEVDIEAIHDIKELANTICTNVRLEQGLEFVTLDIDNISAYIKWVVQDVFKEEGDLIKPEYKKQMSKILANKARYYFLEQLDRVDL